MSSNKNARARVIDRAVGGALLFAVLLLIGVRIANAAEIAIKF